MTEGESHNFIVQILQGHWPKWQFTEAQIEGWAKRLRLFDFQRARKCIEDYAFRQSRQGLPPVGQVIDAMKAAIIPQDYSDYEPIHVYEIVKEGNTRGYRFSIARRKDLPLDPREMESRAERDRQKCQELFSNVKWVVLQRWQKYYE